jgi:hypothetical protein
MYRICIPYFIYVVQVVHEATWRLWFSCFNCPQISLTVTSIRKCGLKNKNYLRSKYLFLLLPLGPNLIVGAWITSTTTSTVLYKKHDYVQYYDIWVLLFTFVPCMSRDCILICGCTSTSSVLISTTPVKHTSVHNNIVHQVLSIKTIKFSFKIINKDAFSMKSLDQLSWTT